MWILRRLLGKEDGCAHVYLDKNKDYVYCFLREQVIEESVCDYYEHNCECDKNDDFWGRTHPKHTIAGYRVYEFSGNFLNDCRYCLDKNVHYEKYNLPLDSKYNENKSFNKYKHWR